MSAQRLIDYDCNACGYLFDAIEVVYECPNCNSSNIKQRAITNNHDEITEDSEKEIVKFFCGSCKEIGETIETLPIKCPFCGKENSLSRKSIKTN